MIETLSRNVPLPSDVPVSAKDMVSLPVPVPCVVAVCHVLPNVILGVTSTPFHNTCMSLECAGVPGLDL